MRSFVRPPSVGAAAQSRGFAIGCFTTSSRMPAAGRLRPRSRRCSPGQHRRSRRCCRSPFGQRCHLRAVGRHDGQRQQVAECIDRDVHLRPFAALGPIVAGSCAALRGRLQRAAIDAHCRRLALALGPLARNLPHIGHQHRKAARLDPAPYLLVHRDPGRKIVRRQPLRATLNTLRDSRSAAGCPRETAANMAARTPTRRSRTSLVYPTPILTRTSMLHTKITPAKNLLRYKVHNRL